MKRFWILWTAAAVLAIGISPHDRVGAQAPAPVPPKPAAVRIIGPEKVEPYKLVRLSAEGSYKSAVWFVDPEEAVDLYDVPGGREVVWTAKPGVYRVKVVALEGEILTKASATVTIGNPQPGPGPNPNPGPNPLPSKLAWVIVVEETSTRTPQVAAVVLSPKLREAVSKTGAQFRLIDPTPGNVPEGFVQWAKLAGTDRCVFLVDDKGGYVRHLLPATEAATIALIPTGRAKQ